MADPTAPPLPARVVPPGGHEVKLNVYDVVPPAIDDLSDNVRTAPLTRLNNLTRNLFGGVGGVFHGAIVIGEDEWSFGFCENGTGVYRVKAGQNPMYTYRETLSLGPTMLDEKQISAITRRLRLEWAGNSYDLLNRNCCHFCDVMASELGVDPVPAWLNRFATTAAAAMQATNDASNTMRNVRDELTRISNESYSWLKASVAKASEQLQEAAQQGGTGARSGLRKAPAIAATLGGALRSATHAAARGLSVALNGRDAAGRDAGGDAWRAAAEAAFAPGGVAVAPAAAGPAGAAGLPEAASAAAAAKEAPGAAAAARQRPPGPPPAHEALVSGMAAAALAGGGVQPGKAGGSGPGAAASDATPSDEEETFLPTTALRWGSFGAGGGGAPTAFVGSGQALGLPQRGEGLRSRDADE